MEHNLDSATRGLAHDGIACQYLPEGLHLSYLNEGAANIVYRIVTKNSTPPPSVLELYGEGTPPPTELGIEDDITELEMFQDKLLRLRKELPTTGPTIVAYQSWKRLVRPLFGTEELVDQVLVRLQSGNIITHLNDELVNWEQGSISLGFGLRPAKRKGTYLAYDGYGLLVTDMTPRHSGQDMVEFKPKWLVQSPSAPRNSKRCRTCALTARRNAELARSGETPISGFCPLDLVSPEPQNLRNVAEVLLSTRPLHASVPRFSSWLQQTSILKRLRDLQVDLDPLGVLNRDAVEENLQVAMTLRDCTIFVRFSDNPESDYYDVEARIGDLDLKSTSKMEYWRNVEHELIEEGWYQGTEKATNAQPLICSLSRER